MSDPFYRTARWRKLRELVLSRHPFCVTPGCGAVAVVADHLVPRSEGGADSLENLVGRCIPCHNARRGTGEPRLRGCRGDGTPVDPRHWWNAPPTRLKNRSELRRADRRPPPFAVSSPEGDGDG